MISRRITYYIRKIAVCVLFTYFFVSLLTYSSQDSAVNVISSDEITNLGGILGAVIADISFQYFGLYSIALAITLVNAFYSQRSRNIKYIATYFALCSSYFFFTYYENIDENWLYSNYAGIFGFLTYMDSLSVFKTYIHYCSPVLFCLSNIIIFKQLSDAFISVFHTSIKYTIAIVNFISFCILFCTKRLYKMMYVFYALIFSLLAKKKRSKEPLNINCSDDEIINEYNDSDLYQEEVDDNYDDIKDIYDDNNNHREEEKNYENISDVQPDEIEDEDIEQEELEECDEDVDDTDCAANKHFANKTYDVSKFELPSLNFLDKKREINQNVKVMEDKAAYLGNVLLDFGIKGKITNVSVGPVVTLYELKPEAGTKSARIISLAGDIARSMSAISARISVIPGKNAIGIELPNDIRKTVYLRELFAQEQYCASKYKLPIALGQSIDGKPIVVDLAKMPHLLVAGTTGSGKSVAVNAMILSLLYRLTPEQCRFIMIDPKMLELSVYNNIPNLLTPVVTEPKKAVIVLKWLTQEMERRYKLMSVLSVRNIGGYNSVITNDKSEGEFIQRRVLKKVDKMTGNRVFETVSIERKALPFIVVIIDEMADLMIVAGKEIESYLQRLAQMARASGIHIIMATQRPSVDVITGVIKANFPTRISFAVSSRIDSRTIIGEQGAEQLLGRGDMLYMSPGRGLKRIHGPFVSDTEVKNIVEYLNSQFSDDASEDVLMQYSTNNDLGINNDLMNVNDTESDELFAQAVKIILEEKRTSISYIQRRLKIGFNRAASLIEEMERKEIIGPQQSNGKRDILISNFHSSTQ
ncbi:DNA translocase FtsK [Anaplasmataceae bacterium AB001_6]|nr:DNA translocase FtsK [Anaplasmataceae bacterium AB001_6]